MLYNNKNSGNINEVSTNGYVQNYVSQNVETDRIFYGNNLNTSILANLSTIAVAVGGNQKISIGTDTTTHTNTWQNK